MNRRRPKPASADAGFVNRQLGTAPNGALARTRRPLQLSSFRITPAQNIIRLTIRAMLVHFGRPRTRRRGIPAFAGARLSTSDASPIVYVAPSWDTDDQRHQRWTVSAQSSSKK